ncbi:hypothetical protein D046_3495B, partial [Vibrio parahaemolyticus V-223/04]
PCFWPTQS